MSNVAAKLLPTNLSEMCSTGAELSRVLQNGHNRQVAQRVSKRLFINDQVATDEQRQEMAEELAALNGPAESFRVFSIQVSNMFDAPQLKNLPSSTKMMLLTENHWAARWGHFGLPLFNLTENLAAALLLTEPPTELDELRLPFPAFAVTLPPGLISVHHYDQTASATLLRVHRHVGVVANNPRTDMMYVSLHSDTGRALYRLCSVEELLQDDDRVIDTGLQDVSTRDLEKDNLSLAAVVRLVRNLVAWIEAHGTGSPEPKKKPGYTRRQQTVPVPTTWMLGREVKLAPELRRMASEVASGDREGWKLRMRYCVRGHWRWQACGEGLRDRKRIFIEPYWKGPEGAAAWQHIYKVTP